MSERMRQGLTATLATAGYLLAMPTQAGVPECGNVRVEDAVGCELRASASCSAACSELGVYKKACATQLYERCSKVDCTLKAEETCQNPCTDACKTQCDRGADINCQHNCFGECKGVCDEQCADSDEPENCRASCEATCDGECDMRCEGVDGDCYYQCTECCHGSCSAEANLDCQEDCQTEEFESCEYDLRVDCDASCEVDGALFCDGEFVIGGTEDLANCAEALVDRGLLAVDFNVAASAAEDAAEALADGSVAVDALPVGSLPTELDASGSVVISGSAASKANASDQGGADDGGAGGNGCHFAATSSPRQTTPFALLALGAALARRRRRAARSPW